MFSYAQELLCVKLFTDRKSWKREANCNYCGVIVK